MFSVIERCGMSASSWWMMTMPFLLAVPDAVEAALLALEEELALVRAVRVDAGHDLHQGRLAGAVLADQGVDLARADGEA